MHKNSTYNSLSCDILFSIFINLPLKTLLRFKSVSTQWKNIISGDLFVKTHRDQSKALGHEKLLLQNKSTGGFKLIDIKNPQIVIETQEEFPMKNYNVLCSLDGLLLLKNEHMNFVLWNPSTRQHQDLESCPYLNNYARPHASGLCYYDFITDAYKVILIYGLFYVVYSTSTHSWTIKQHLLGLPASFELLRSYFWNRGISRGTSIEGCVYWSLPWKLKENGGKTSIIICFDVKSDELKELPSPDLYNDRWLLTSTLKGCLVLYNVNYSTMKSNIWIIEQDGWRLLTQPICDVQPLSLEEHFIVLEAALCLMGNDELIFYRSRYGTHHDLSIYNIEQQRFVMTNYKLNHHEFLFFSQDVTCLESLCFPRLN
ncbi:hypothetical protein P3S67_013173 [Capsicum chacoense]